MCLHFLAELIAAATTGVDVVAASFRVGDGVDWDLGVGFHVSAAEREVVWQAVSVTDDATEGC